MYNYSLMDASIEHTLEPNTARSKSSKMLIALQNDKLIRKLLTIIFPKRDWVGCGTWLYRFLIFAPVLTLELTLQQSGDIDIIKSKFKPNLCPKPKINLLPFCLLLSKQQTFRLTFSEIRSCALQICCLTQLAVIAKNMRMITQHGCLCWINEKLRFGDLGRYIVGSA